MADDEQDWDGDIHVSAKALRKAIIGDTSDLVNEVLGGLTDGNVDFLADALVKRGQMGDRVLSNLTDGNWNYICNNLWKPNKLLGYILRYLQSNPTTGIH